jgi:hypothetical protein
MCRGNMRKGFSDKHVWRLLAIEKQYRDFGKVQNHRIPTHQGGGVEIPRSLNHPSFCSLLASLSWRSCPYHSAQVRIAKTAEQGAAIKDAANISFLPPISSIVRPKAVRYQQVWMHSLTLQSLSLWFSWRGLPHGDKTLRIGVIHRRSTDSNEECCYQEGSDESLQS